MRGHGPRALGAGSVQLLRSRHRQHGNVRALRHDEQQDRAWCEPLLDGEIRSAFLDDRAGCGVRRTPPTSRPASRATATDYVINGRKWWSSGAGDPRCKIFIVMGKTDPTARTPQAAVDDPGAGRHARREGLRHLPVFGYDDAPHGHMEIASRKRTRTCLEYAARRGPRIRDRARSPRPRPHPPLHAPDRTGRDGARKDVQACSGPCRVRPSRSPTRALRASASQRRAS